MLTPEEEEEIRYMPKVIPPPRPKTPHCLQDLISADLYGMIDMSKYQQNGI
jgi:hypothetical protein